LEAELWKNKHLADIVKPGDEVILFERGSKSGENASADKV
jgi:hypothetical protein